LRPGLYEALLRTFGGIQAARRRLGRGRIERPRKWTQSRVISELQEASRKGITISLWGLVRAGRRDLAYAARRVFGGLERARARAGIAEPSRRGGSPTTWSPELIAKQIRRRSNAGLSIAATKAPQPLVNAGKRYFGSWRAAVEAAGLEYDRVRLYLEPYSKRQLIAALRQAAVGHPEWTQTDLSHSSLGGAASRLYGSLERALHVAGITGWPRRIIHDVQPAPAVLRAIRARRRAGDSLRYRDVAREANWIVHSATRHFGTWNGALDAARVAAPENKWTEATIMRALRARMKARRSMRAIDVRREDAPLYAAVIARFGGYYAAAKKLGVKRTDQQWSKERVRRELRKRVVKGRVTRRRAGIKLVSASTRYFGSFAAAKREAGVA
jgi:hypothetical protein